MFGACNNESSCFSTLSSVVEFPVLAKSLATITTYSGLHVWGVLQWVNTLLSHSAEIVIPKLASSARSSSLTFLLVNVVISTTVGQAFHVTGQVSLLTDTITRRSTGSGSSKNLSWDSPFWKEINQGIVKNTKKYATHKAQNSPFPLNLSPSDLTGYLFLISTFCFIGLAFRYCDNS